MTTYINLQQLIERCKGKSQRLTVTAHKYAESGAYSEALKLSTEALAWSTLGNVIELDVQFGEIDAIEQATAAPCPDCNDTGVVPNPWGTGEASGGWGDVCECGRGKA